MTPRVGSSSSIAEVGQDGLGITCAGCHHPLTQEKEPHVRKRVIWGCQGQSMPPPGSCEVGGILGSERGTLFQVPQRICCRSIGPGWWVAFRGLFLEVYITQAGERGSGMLFFRAFYATLSVLGGLPHSLNQPILKTS